MDIRDPQVTNDGIKVSVMCHISQFNLYYGTKLHIGIVHDEGQSKETQIDLFPHLHFVKKVCRKILGYAGIYF